MNKISTILARIKLSPNYICSLLLTKEEELVLETIAERNQLSKSQKDIFRFLSAKKMLRLKIELYLLTIWHFWYLIVFFLVTNTMLFRLLSEVDANPNIILILSLVELILFLVYVGFVTYQGNQLLFYHNRRYLESSINYYETLLENHIVAIKNSEIEIAETEN